jgi:putative membrane protein
MKRSLKEYTLIALKGIGMGAADIVPGVSGGTIALITGIYEEFVDTLKSFNLSAIKTFKNDGILGVWKHINGNFLVALVLGIGISLISMVKVIKYLLADHPILIWSFFFGLIVASAIFVGKTITKWNLSTIIGLIGGTVLIYWITSVVPAATPNTWWSILISGAIAICAMILPGISGSFILVLLGKYAYIIESLSQFKLDVIALFGMGCVTGLLSFSHLLSWLLKNYHSLTMAILTGFMVGSLNKIWPWKETLSYMIDRHGEQKPLEQINLMPQHFDGDSQLLGAIALAIVGFVLIFALEGLGNRFKKA